MVRLPQHIDVKADSHLVIITGIKSITMKLYHVLIAVALFGVSHLAMCQTGLSASEKANLNRVYEFNVVLQNDSTLKTKSKILFDNQGRNYISAKMLADKNIYPSETKYLYKKGTDGTSLKGVAADSCWLFLSNRGKINSYSNIPERGMDFIVAIQQGANGPILPLNRDNLIALVANDSKALALAQQNDLVSAIVQYNQPTEIVTEGGSN